MKPINTYIKEQEINEDYVPYVFPVWLFPQEQNLQSALTLGFIALILWFLYSGGLERIKIGIRKIDKKLDELDYAFLDWKKDKKVTKIAKRLGQDQEVVEFLKLPKSEQRGKWRKLLQTKLSEDEIQYIQNLTKNKVAGNMES